MEINKLDNSGRNSLSNAIPAHNLETVKSLIDNGANIN